MVLDRLTARRAVEPGRAPDLDARLQVVLREAPAPLRDAVASVGVDEGSIRVTFRPPGALAPKEVEGRTVECLLY